MHLAIMSIRRRRRLPNHLMMVALCGPLMLIISVALFGQQFSAVHRVKAQRQKPLEPADSEELGAARAAAADEPGAADPKQTQQLEEFGHFEAAKLNVSAAAAAAALRRPSTAPPSPGEQRARTEAPEPAPKPDTRPAPPAAGHLSRIVDEPAGAEPAQEAARARRPAESAGAAPADEPILASANEGADSRAAPRPAARFRVTKRNLFTLNNSLAVEADTNEYQESGFRPTRLALPGAGQPEADAVAGASERAERSSNCALILKRTYIMDGLSQDEWGDKFVFNELDSEGSERSDEPVGDGAGAGESAGKKRKRKAAGAARKKRTHKTELCIRYSDVDKAIEEAKHRVKFELPADLDSLDVSEASLAQVGELNLATGQILTQKFDLSHDEILNALPMIDMSASRFFARDMCPKIVRPMGCSKAAPYRTITGHCNNLKHPSWGASRTPYSRYLPPDYADGLTLPRADQDGQPLPSARLVTSIVHTDSDEPSHDYSALFASFGQLVNHDMTQHAASANPDCCPQYLKGLCMPIPVPPSDPLYSRFNVKCLKFDRSLAAIRPKCLLGLRAQINLVTSPIDASFVYGSTNSLARKLRTFNEGKMRVLNYFDKLKLKPLLPPKTEEPDDECLGRPKNLYCFLAGDVRANEQTHLTVLHTVYIREHNRIAKHLAKLNPDWDDDKLYHETRHIVAAGVQHVVFNEFLPLLLNQQLLDEYSMKPSKDGHWIGYDPFVTTSTGTGFAAAAFRYGHSMVEGIIKQFDTHGRFIEGKLLRNLFKRPFLLYKPGVMDQLIMGMVLTATEQTDPFVTEELSGHLFQPPKSQFGHDLPAINIQRGRDQGVPGYNDWREWCGLPRAKTFSDLEPLLMNRTAYQYSRIYKHVDDIDLWSAGVSERKMQGSAVGPTMACIIARQFLNSKRGDRFWYENPGLPSSFSPAQLKEIKKISLAKILCTNSDGIRRIQPWSMRLPHPIYNAKISCDALPNFNLNLWEEK